MGEWMRPETNFIFTPITCYCFLPYVSGQRMESKLTTSFLDPYHVRACKTLATILCKPLTCAKPEALSGAESLLRVLCA